MSRSTPRLLWVLAAATAASVAPIAVYGASTEPERRSDSNVRRVCEVQRTTGSRLGGTVRCRSKAERDAEKAESRNTVERVQGMRATACGMPGSGC